MSCEFCGKKELMPYKCVYCGRSFCSEHRLPEKHDCEGLKAGVKPTPAKKQKPPAAKKKPSSGYSTYTGEDDFID